jgi:hypothetical protein
LRRKCQKKKKDPLRAAFLAVFSCSAPLFLFIVRYFSRKFKGCLAFSWGKAVVGGRFFEKIRFPRTQLCPLSGTAGGRQPKNRLFFSRRSALFQLAAEAFVLRRAD